MAHTLFLGTYFLLPVATWMLRDYVPVWLLFPAGFMTAAGVYALHVKRLHRATGATGGIPYRDLESTVSRLWHRMDGFVTAEEHNRLHLLGLGDLWKAVAQSTRIQDMFDGILSYCQRQGGFSEVGVLLLEPATEELVGTWSLPVDQGTHLRRVRWSIRGLGGGVATVLRTARGVRSTDPEMQPILRVNGERPQPRTNHESYLAVPIVSPLPRPECLEEGWLYHDDCPAFEPVAGYGESAHRDGLDLGPCLRCRHFPVHGVLLVTDMNRQEAINDSDQRLATDLAATIAAVLDHAALFRGVQAEEQFRNQILDAMGSGLITTDPAGNVVFANRRALELVGESTAVFGVALGNLVEILSAADPLQHALVEGREALHLEGFLKRDDGERVPIRVNIGPVRPQAGGPRGAVCVFADLSGEKAMEEEIRHLDTLAAIGRFASSMAHEIRNPLGGISAGVGYLARSVHLDPEATENVGVVQSEIERLDGIIRNLMVVARPKEVQLRPCDPRALVDKVVRSLSPWAQQRRVEIVPTVRLIEPWPYIDGDMIHQVLVNLIKNAVEASPQDTSVEVTLDRFSPELEEGGVKIQVTDAGTGIDAEDLPQLFEPFFSKKQEGTGLGLYVCHNFVQRHGGTLTAKNRPEGGAHFELRLPTYPALLGESHEPTRSYRR